MAVAKTAAVMIVQDAQREIVRCGDSKCARVDEMAVASVFLLLWHVTVIGKWKNEGAQNAAICIVCLPACAPIEWKMDLVEQANSLIVGDRTSGIINFCFAKLCKRYCWQSHWTEWIRWWTRRRSNCNRTEVVIVWIIYGCHSGGGRGKGNARIIILSAMEKCSGAQGEEKQGEEMVRERKGPTWSLLTSVIRH